MSYTYKAIDPSRRRPLLPLQREDAPGQETGHIINLKLDTGHLKI